MHPQTHSTKIYPQHEWDQLPAHIRTKAVDLLAKAEANPTITHPITQDEMTIEPEGEHWVEQCHNGGGEPDYYQLVVWYWNTDDQNIYVTVDLG